MSHNCVEWLTEDKGRKPTWGELSELVSGEDLCIELISGCTANIDIANRVCHWAGRGWDLLRIDLDGVAMKKSGFANLLLTF